MESLVFRVLAASVGLYLVDLVAYGFVLGFGVFFALCAVSGLLFWLSYRWMPMRTQKPSASWQWAYFGNQLIRMEVA